MRLFTDNSSCSRAKTLTLQDERGQLHNVLVEGGGHGARLQVRLELQEELVPRDLLPQLARAARVEFHPKVELVHAAPCKRCHIQCASISWSLSFLKSISNSYLIYFSLV